MLHPLRSSLLLLAACAPSSPAAPLPVDPTPPPPVAEPKPAEPQPVADPKPVAEPVASKPADPKPADAPQTWPLDLTHDLDTGCLGWSQSEAAAVCSVGGGSIQMGHDYVLSFLGGKPEDIKIASYPPHHFEAQPTILPKDAQTRVAARLTAGNYTAIPARTAELTPNAPYEADRFTLRWIRKKTSHVDAGTGEWDVFKDSIQIACTKKPNKPRKILGDTIENPGSDTADVYVLSPALVLVYRHNHWGIEGEIGAIAEAALVDLDREGC